MFVISKDKIFDPAEARRKGKPIILINNGIHPGEPDGIDASVRVTQDYLSGKAELPGNVIICIIPVFNIDGSLRQGCCTRANQNGPLNQGFRGNARNLDLNRDFIKCDSENARSFTALFHSWDPDVFVDTHVSNGADYQYTMTLISTQHNKLGGEAGNFIKNKMTPAIFEMMKEQGEEMAPYVNTTRYDAPPETGIYGFPDLPRYASGYAALFHCLAFVPETHMLKPFEKRVEATIKLLQCFVKYTSQNSAEITRVRQQSKLMVKTQNEFALNWQADTSVVEWINFKGFQPEYRVSKVTGAEQLYYNRELPFEKEIKFYDHYIPVITIKKPSYYIIPQAWKEVIERLRLNRIKMEALAHDSLIPVTRYVIQDFNTVAGPYEGHYLHHSVVTSTVTEAVPYFKGDLLIPVNQDGNRYIIETLEPTAPDSWFAWGFFDAILQQKEWFSSYVFDELAFELLEKNPELKVQFHERRNSDPAFRESAFEQLYFIYKNSDWFEPFRRYPVGRIEPK